MAEHLVKMKKVLLWSCSLWQVQKSYYYNHERDTTAQIEVKTKDHNRNFTKNIFHCRGFRICFHSMSTSTQKMLEVTLWSSITLISCTDLNARHERDEITCRIGKEKSYFLFSILCTRFGVGGLQMIFPYLFFNY